MLHSTSMHTFNPSTHISFNHLSGRMSEKESESSSGAKWKWWKLHSIHFLHDDVVLNNKVCCSMYAISHAFEFVNKAFVAPWKTVYDPSTLNSPSMQSTVVPLGSFKEFTNFPYSHTQSRVVSWGRCRRSIMLHCLAAPYQSKPLLDIRHIHTHAVLQGDDIMKPNMFNSSQTPAVNVRRFQDSALLFSSL